MHRITLLRHVVATWPSSSFVLLPLSASQYVSMSSSATAVQTQSDKLVDISAERKTRIRNISKSLEIYLESLRAHEKMMSHERAQFELGKRHLANIMGWPADFQITQDDIDRAIKYLFPSALTDKLALPVMRPPDEILPKFKKMDFDSFGRPLDPLFYTRTPKFYKILSEVHKRTLELVDIYDKQLLGKLSKDSKSSILSLKTDESQLILSGSNWISQEKLSKCVLADENISEEMYASLLLALEYLVEHPLAHRHAEFILSLRESMTGSSQSAADVANRSIFQATVPIPQLDVNTGQHYAVGRGRVKRVVVEARVTKNGTGEYTVDGHHYSEFRQTISRELLLCPLIVTDLLGKVDVSATVVEHAGGGIVLIPRAVRHAVSLAVAALYPEHREKLRLAGLLTYDPRRKERSKINQPGARAKWIWKKR